jgi:hypothetical protein
MLQVGASMLIATLAAASAPAMVVDLGTSDMPTKISVQVCAGLLNRADAADASTVYTLMNEPYDSEWLADAEQITNPDLTAVDTVLSNCVSNEAVKGYIKYNYKDQQILVPNLITMAAVLDAVLLEEGQAAAAGVPMVFDAVAEWAGFDALDASKYVYEHHVKETSTLAWMNPGYDGHANATHPPLTGDLNPGLIDYIVKEKIFNFYLNNACIPTTPDYEFMLRMTTHNPWPRPIPVYGYGDEYPVAGDIFEAETNCNHAHNMGQVASAGTNNLAFMSRKPEITVDTPMRSNPAPLEAFNESMSYLSFIMGDGDNVQYLKTSRRDWMKSRVSRCEADPSYFGCFPLSWSISPHPRFFAPDWFCWYYNQSYKTLNDYFVLPPSGDLYSYPSEFPEDVQAQYVKNTERDCELLTTSGSVHWEWLGHWAKAVEEYFPQYSAAGVVKGFFAVNVPYNVPVVEIFRPGEFYKIVQDNVVVFRPREWRGTEFSRAVPLSRRQFLSVDEQTALLNNLPRGTITCIYVTSDGGGGLDMIYDLVKQLDAHVKVVSHEALIDLALQRG